MSQYSAALDQGTTSTRFIVFDHGGRVICYDQKEHEQIYPRPGWVEHNPMEIWTRTQEVIKGTLTKGHFDPRDIIAIGVTNQRETAVVWERKIGQPVYNAIVWQDTRTADICVELAHEGGQDRLRAQTGLPLATYFSGPKIKWILDDGGLQDRQQSGRVLPGRLHRHHRRAGAVAAR
jgi:glycerol kinase